MPNKKNAKMRSFIWHKIVEKEKRLEEAVDAGLRMATSTKHELEFSDLCVD